MVIKMACCRQWLPRAQKDFEISRCFQSLRELNIKSTGRPLPGHLEKNLVLNSVIRLVSLPLPSEFFGTKILESHG